MSLPEREPEESRKAQVDRELGELLQELRVAVTGVQVLFAFLLAVPFQVGFDRLDTVGRSLYFVALVGSAAASVCFITPAVQHRLLFRTRFKERMLKRGGRLAIAGSASLAVAISSSVALVTEFVLSEPLVALVAVGVAGAVTWLWWIQAIVDLRGQPPHDLS
ncbi:DUF6328 family protein [Nonomuraea sp. NPDC048916]|uniref:DUF6328 family protein n=1 Tax=Nonomuraea sp. NPDC048916 TaxID=3154232 RepID=UPI00340C3D95